jgi:hypothetical protein
MDLKNQKAIRAKIQENLTKLHKKLVEVEIPLEILEEKKESLEIKYREFSKLREEIENVDSQEEEKNEFIEEKFIMVFRLIKNQLLYEKEKEDTKMNVPCTRGCTQVKKRIQTELFRIEKYTGAGDPKIWIELLEKEYDRLGVTENEEKIEILNLFLEGTPREWYSSVLIKHGGYEGKWQEWKDKFTISFEKKGWGIVKNALEYRYLAGSLQEYAIKKQRLLLEMRPSMDEGTLIDLIIAGLPNSIKNSIDRGCLNNTTEVFNHLNRYEHLINKREFKNTRTEKSPCQNCIKLNKGYRYHEEYLCRFKNEQRNNYIKHNNQKNESHH